MISQYQFLKLFTWPYDKGSKFTTNLLLPSEIRNKAYGATNLLLNQRNQWSNNTYLNRLENKKEIPLFPNY